MTVQPNPSAFAFDGFLRAHESKGLLRVVFCGSVDHGKSTLIGRLLFEAKLLLEDQLDALASDSRRYGTQGKELDFALLLDGLAAEREQKITIDVAYRFFTTAKRKFIVADAPGHEQYTRNMATGASTADVAVLLINAEQGLMRQTRRHSFLVSMLGVRRLVVVVNKMDRIGFSQARFAAIEADFRALARKLDIDDLVFIPICARDGDNVVRPSRNMDWYRGSTLLEHLEQIEIASDAKARPFRMPIQLVNRPTPDFRGYSGMIASGEAFVGMPVRILPAGETSCIARIVTYDGDVDRASSGRSVTITLADDLDGSRGDVIAEVDQPPAVTDRLAARIVWMGKEPLVADRSYLIKLATASATAKFEPALRVLDLETLESKPAERLFINDIGEGALRLDRAIAADAYTDSRDTGSFIIIDPDTYDTIGMGMVDRARNAEPAQGIQQRDWKALLPPSLAQRLAPRASDSHLRSVVKAITWRSTGSLDTFLVSLVITRSSLFAGSIALAEILTKIALYYFHERIWSFVRWGKPASPRD